MECEVVFEKESVQLKKAILVYATVRPSDHYMFNSGAEAYASVHDVKLNEGIPTIESGRPIGTEEIEGIIEGIKGHERLSMMDERVLAKNGASIVFWVKSQKRATWLECRGEEPKNATVWHPSTVFVVGKKGLYVYAIKGDKRPTKDTILYKPPYLNAGANGSVCMGNRKLPRAHESEIDNIIEAFFTSSFTHAIGSGLVDYEGGVYALWFDLINGKCPNGFPQKSLTKFGAGDFTMEKMIDTH